MERCRLAHRHRAHKGRVHKGRVHKARVHEHRVHKGRVHEHRVHKGRVHKHLGHRQAGISARRRPPGRGGDRDANSNWARTPSHMDRHSSTPDRRHRGPGGYTGNLPGHRGPKQPPPGGLHNTSRSLSSRLHSLKTVRPTRGPRAACFQAYTMPDRKTATTERERDFIGPLRYERETNTGDTQRKDEADPGGRPRAGERVERDDAVGEGTVDPRQTPYCP
jgi:hypothetical protein